MKLKSRSTNRWNYRTLICGEAILLSLIKVIKFSKLLLFSYIASMESLHVVWQNNVPWESVCWLRLLKEGPFNYNGIESKIKLLPFFIYICARAISWLIFRWITSKGSHFTNSFSLISLLLSFIFWDLFIWAKWIAC